MPNVLEQLLGGNNQGVDTQKILQQLFGTGSLQGGSRQIQQPAQGQPSSGDLLSMEMNAAAGRKRLSKKADSEAEQIELDEGSQGLTNRVAKLEGIIEQQKQTIEKEKEQQQMRFIQNPNPFGLGGPDPEENFRDIGWAMKILSLLAGAGIPSGVEEAQAAQQMAGQQPMQRGEREKIGLQTAADMGKFYLEESAKAEQAGYLTPQVLHNNFEKTAEVFINTRDSFARIQAATKNPSAAGDLALIFNYMKILDPGSVVRESEFANAAASGSLGSRWVAAGRRLIRGERLSKTMRADFLDRSKKLFRSIETQQAKSTQEFRKLAVRNKLDPNVLFRDIGLVQEEQNTTPGGNTFRRIE